MKDICWDGSYLGCFPRKCIKCKIHNKTNGILHHILCLEEGTKKITCQMKKYSDVHLPCILDEIKPLFGIPKIGTHRIQIGKTHYILYKSHLSDMLITKFNTKEKKMVKKYMKPNIAFRMLLCVSTIQNSSFIYKRNQKHSPIFSAYETKTSLGVSNVFPSEHFAKFWLDNDENVDLYLSEFISLLIENSAQSNKLEFLVKLQSDLEKIINRVNSDYVWLISPLIQELHKYD